MEVTEFYREIERSLAVLQEQSKNILRTLDEFRGELQTMEIRLRKLEFSYERKRGMFITIAALGSVFGGLGMWIFERLL
jgi:hypothetical protein